MHELANNPPFDSTIALLGHSDQHPLVPYHGILRRA
jgi:hypothetical protein